MQMISLILRDKYSAIYVCVVNVASYDNYMLIYSYLAFCFLLFSMTTLLQLDVCIYRHLLVGTRPQSLPSAVFRIIG